MAIAERITDYWGITEGNLFAQPALNYARAKVRTVDDVIFDLYLQHAPSVTPPTAATVNAFSTDLVERYVAAAATLRLIPIARDFYMQDRISKSQTASFGGGLSATYIKKIDELDKLEERLLAEIARLLPLVVDEIEPEPPITETHPHGPSVVFPDNRVVNPVAEYNRRRGVVA